MPILQGEFRSSAICQKERQLPSWHKGSAEKKLAKCPRFNGRFLQNQLRVTARVTQISVIQ